MEKSIKKLNSAALDGIEAFLVKIEASFTKGLPNFNIVGLGDEAIRESKERIKSALLLLVSKIFPSYNYCLISTIREIQKRESF